jgi:hypothetical protein
VALVAVAALDAAKGSLNSPALTFREFLECGNDQLPAGAGQCKVVDLGACSFRVVEIEPHKLDAWRTAVDASELIMLIGENY